MSRYIYNNLRLRGFATVQWTYLHLWCVWRETRHVSGHQTFSQCPTDATSSQLAADVVPLAPITTHWCGGHTGAMSRLAAVRRVDDWQWDTRQVPQPTGGRLHWTQHWLADYHLVCNTQSLHGWLILVQLVCRLRTLKWWSAHVG